SPAENAAVTLQQHDCAACAIRAKQHGHEHEPRFCSALPPSTRSSPTTETVAARLSTESPVASTRAGRYCAMQIGILEGTKSLANLVTSNAPPPAVTFTLIGVSTTVSPFCRLG